jgi:hypothetical protein
MTTQTHFDVTETPTPEATDLSNLSFAEYEAVRRGEAPKVSVKEEQSAPTEEKPQKEQKKSPESDPEETEAKEESESDESEDEESDEETESKDDAKDKPKKKGGFQRRIDKLNAQKAEAQKEAEYWRRKALESAGGQDKASEKVEAKQSSQSSEGEPNPDDFESHTAYVKALAVWTYKQEQKEEQAKSEKARLVQEQEKIVKTYLDRVESFKKEHKDFEDVVADVDDIQVSPSLRSELLASENGPELVYELAKNRAEYERINSLPPLALARELGKLEAKLTARASEAKKQEPNKLTKAPKPIDPVSSGKATVSKKPEEMSFSEYERHRREQMKRRGA